MKNLFYAFTAMLLLISLLAFSATETALRGKVTDKVTRDTLLFANITLYQNGKIIDGTTTDLDGNYQFLNITPGTYDIEASFLGYESRKIINVKVMEGMDNKLDIQLTQLSTSLEEIVITAYRIPMMEVDQCTQGNTITPSHAAKRKQNRRKKKNHIAAENLSINSYLRMAPPTQNMRRETPASPSHGIRDTISDSGSETYESIVENPFIRPQHDPLSTFSIDVDAASYSNIRRFINNGNLPQKDAVRIEEMINYFNYDYPEPTGEHPFEIITELSDCPWQQEHKLLHIGLQGKHIATADLPASNLVFLLDVSGSMGSQNKLPLLKESLALLVDNLREKDKVTIVVYAGAAGLVLEPTNGTDKNKIKEALTNLNAGGSTAGGAGIQLAYNMARKSFIQGGNNRVILATDGDFNVGLQNDNDLVKLIEKERNSGVFLTVLGFGTGNYQDAKMQKLADKGNGNHAYIDNLSEAKKVLINEFGGTLFTIARDVKLQLEFNPAHIAGYRLIGYENRLLANEDFNDDTKDAGELGAGHTVTALYEIIPAGQNSPFLADIDDLKFQKTKTRTKAKRTNEWVHIKFRYKKPEGRKSLLIERAVVNQNTKLKDSSNNFKWSAAVAEFGLLLRDSKYKGKATWLHLPDKAKNGKGDDKNGYRQEMIDLIQKGSLLAANKKSDG